MNVLVREEAAFLFKLNKKAPGSTILDKHSDSDISNITSNRDAISLPNDTIYTTVPSDTALTVHEIEHQSQYQNGDKKELFKTLVITDAEGKVLLTLEDFSKARVEVGPNGRTYDIIIGGYLYQ
ncbi:MAG: hypothetical protein IKK79_05200 [Spirochaetaceae bacterium]|nr:hypothetical protein [Spirochaetaceae bacterium]